ncbi:MAG: aminotransferase class I/II-fold pyridoxal phosphate-dependent enzyme, partial [Candidatus Bathyarchaeia archaeon]
ESGAYSKIVYLPCTPRNGFIPEPPKRRVDLIYLCSPNNPTGATVTKSDLKNFVEFCLDNGLILCYDNAYSEVTCGGYRAPSVLEVNGAMEIAVEVHSCSKTFNMTGDRIGFAVGNSEIIEGLVKVKSQVDSGPSKYVQRAAVAGLSAYKSSEQPRCLKEINRTYWRRAKVLVGGLKSLGFECDLPKATFYLWVGCGGSSLEFVKKMLQVNVVATPGVGFGSNGEGYIRFALTCSEERIKEACERLKEIF